MITATDLTALGKHLKSYRHLATDETGLHASIDRVLRAGAFVFSHEHTLSPRDRVDFLVTLPSGGRIALEVKHGGTFPDVLEQLSRYAEHADVGGVLLVTTRSNLAARMPPTLRDKPLHAVVVSGAAF